MINMTGKWPFKVGTTSFIDPGPILDNVRSLGPYLDEIELLIFESQPFVSPSGPVPVLPDPGEILQLARLSDALGVTYNVHLPVDVSLTATSRTERRKAVETIARVICLCAPLSPSTHTLHLDFSPAADTRDGTTDVGRWQDCALESLGFLSSRINDIREVSIETLSYPPEYLSGILDEINVALCMDVGHLIRFGYPMLPLFQQYGHRVPLIHLHGVDFSRTPPRDHQGLDRMPSDRLAPVLEILKQFTGVVSLEVFGRDQLNGCMGCLNGHYKTICDQEG